MNQIHAIDILLFLTPLLKTRPKKEEKMAECPKCGSLMVGILSTNELVCSAIDSKKCGYSISVPPRLLREETWDVVLRSRFPNVVTSREDVDMVLTEMVNREVPLEPYEITDEIKTIVSLLSSSKSS
jgi:hypothetical protein